MSIKVIVFDLDDTLFPEVEFMRGGFATTAEWLVENGEKEFRVCFNPEDFIAKCWEKHNAGRQGTIFNDVLTDCGCTFSGEQIQNLVAVYQGHSPQLRLHADAQLLFTSYHRLSSQLLNYQPEHNRGFFFGVITNGVAAIQKRKVRALKLDELCDCILYCEELDAQKPSPIPYRAMMTRFDHNLVGKNFLYIGDHPVKDFAGAKACGWRTARIVRKNGLHGHVVRDSESDAEKIIHSLNEIQVWLAEI
jgi:putative hydrolase of the HAD superfamily